MTLTREEKRVRIAEACGWDEIGRERGLQYRKISRGVFVYFGDPFDSLDACHEMEKVLVGALEKLHNDPETYRRWDAYRSLLENNIHAEAWQKAEAFGLALGLWQPGE